MKYKSNYRIIEKDKFYLQRKTKFGWIYLYNIDNDVFLLSTLAAVVLSFIFILSIIMNDTQLYILYLSIVSAVISLISLFYLKRNFDGIIFAENYITEKIIKNKEKIETKNKRKNVKIHYLDVKTERKEKLEKLKSCSK